MELPESIKHFQAGVDAMLQEGADPSQIAGTLLGIAHQVMTQNYGAEQAAEWVSHMAGVIAAKSIDPESATPH
jgi:hypothetical protein